MHPSVHCHFDPLTVIHLALHSLPIPSLSERSTNSLDQIYPFMFRTMKLDCRFLWWKVYRLPDGKPAIAIVRMKNGGGGRDSSLSVRFGRSRVSVFNVALG